MGLPLRDLVTPHELPWEALRGRSVAVDAYNALYQFLATIRQADGRLFTDPDGRPTSHLIGVFYRVASLLQEGVRPVWVFDGRPPERKAGTLRQRLAAKDRAAEVWQQALEAGDLELARRKAAQTSHLTRPMVDEVRELLAALGVPTVNAPSEGEAQAAWMAQRGLVWASASEDYDSLLFGAPRLVRGLAARGRRGAASVAQLIDRAELLQSLGVDDDELVLIGLLIGTDFNEGVRGIGPKRAVQLVRQHLGWAATVERAGLDPKEAEEVRAIFRHPVVDETVEIAARPFAPDDVRRILIDQHGFSPERVEATLERIESAARRPSGARPSAPAPRGHQTALDAFGGGAP